MLFITDAPIRFRAELEKRDHQVLVIDKKVSLKKVLHIFSPDEIHLMGKPSFGHRFHLKKGSFYAHLTALPLPTFYSHAKKIFVPNKGAKNLLLSRGIDLPMELLPPFIEEAKISTLPLLSHTKHPIFLFLGKKGAEEFCRLELPGSKVVIGQTLRRFASQVLFYPETPEIIASLFAEADVFVAGPSQEFFPSSFLKAGQYGLPIASLPTLGAKEYIRNGLNGYLSQDLQLAALKCLTVNRKMCQEIAMTYTMDTFVDKLIGSK
jgi:glycosyltransferase involved in cell wall biosynthesis